MKPNPVLARLWEQRRSLLIFALAFQLLENLLFTPAMGLLGGVLQGRPVVDSTAVVEFLLSPRGFLVLFLAATTATTLRLVEHAGLSVIVMGALEGERFRPLATFRWLTTELSRLAGLGARMIGCGIAVVAPLLGVAGALAGRLLARHDINYYLANRPSEFVATAVILGGLAAATLAIGLGLLVRWRLVVQVAVLEQRDGNAAFRAAAELSRGIRIPLAGRCLAVVGFELVLLLAAAGLQQFAVWLLLGVANPGDIPLAVSFGALVVLRSVIGAAVTSIGACADAAVFTTFYRRRRRELGGESAFAVIAQAMTSRSATPAWSQAIAVSLVLALVAAAGVNVAVALSALGHEGPTTVTAHRGAHRLAPENTVAAVREASAVGAHYAEIDVQLSKDGVLVVTHDSDFSRVAGVDRKVWDLTYAEIRALPLGARAAPEFRAERIPTFDEVLSVARDRIRLNIELKYYGDHQPRLAERVVAAVNQHGMADRVIVQCLEYEPLLEVRRLAPGIPVGYLLSVNAAHPGRLEVDFLGAEMSRATGAFIHAAHRRGQRVHVWTVDAPDDLERMIDLGVDDLITNDPAEALRRVRAFDRLQPPERALRRVRAWLGRP